MSYEPGNAASARCSGRLGESAPTRQRLKQQWMETIAQQLATPGWNGAVHRILKARCSSIRAQLDPRRGASHLHSVVRLGVVNPRGFGWWGSVHESVLSLF